MLSAPIADRLVAMSWALRRGYMDAATAADLADELAEAVRVDVRARQGVVDRAQVQVTTTCLANLHLVDAIDAALALRPADCCVPGCLDRRSWPDSSIEASIRRQAEADRAEADRLLGG